MFAIFGTRSSAHTTQQILGQCPFCHKSDGLFAESFQRYFHIFWIPVLPLKKTSIITCTHCFLTPAKKDLKTTFQDQLQALKKQIKTPIWMFSGLFLFIAFSIFIGIFAYNMRVKNAELIQSPQKGDIYEIRKANGMYSFERVEDVTGSGVLFRESNYETNKLRELSKIRRDETNIFSDQINMKSKSELKAAFDSGEIIDIER